MKLDRKPDKDMNNQHFKHPQAAWLMGLFLIVGTKAQAMYALTDIEVVPTQRLIANLEKKLAAAPVESDLFGSGERIKIWSWGQLPLDGEHTIDTNGFVNLPGIGKLKLSGRTKAAVLADLNGGKRSGEPGGRGIFLEQSWGQRNGRVQPGETAELHYELGRVYSIDYALAPSKFRALKGGDRPFLGDGAGSGLPPDRDQFRGDGPVDRHPGAETNATVLNNKLTLAITHYREALRRKPDHLPAQLGLAWCLDQAKSKAAVEEYRKALALAWKQEKDQSSILEISWVEEIARYLLPLLDPFGDKAEIEQIKSYTATMLMKGRGMTPILVPLADHLPLKDLVNPTAGVAFDLDGSGIARRWGWITPKAAWLVYDPTEQGKITSGLQLFGNVTFWVFWRNGYEALRALDDDGDGVLTGDELRGLALWQDRDSNGISAPDEVIPLAVAGVTALSTESVRHETGIPYSPSGVRFLDGSFRPTYDWVATPVADSKSAGAQ
jgi:hypothetical protein